MLCRMPLSMLHHKSDAITFSLQVDVAMEYAWLAHWLHRRPARLECMIRVTSENFMLS